MHFSWSWGSFAVGAVTSSLAWWAGMWKTLLEIRKLRRERTEQDEERRIQELMERILAAAAEIRRQHISRLPAFNEDELATLCGASLRDTIRALRKLQREGMAGLTEVPGHWYIKA